MTFTVHPVADLFPMMSDEELSDLAADIKANGLLYPVILDADGQLIDGRNRLRACEIAGVEPDFGSLNGHDPVAYILSANVTRRHLSKGQAAMAVAKSQLLLSNNRQEDAALSVGVSQTRVAQAATVIRHAPYLADAVMSGATSLNEAYTEAQKRKSGALSTESQMVRLRAEAPELADIVVEERMTLKEALAAMEERKRETLRRKEVATRTFAGALSALASVSWTPEAIAEDFVRDLDPSTQTMKPDLSPERIRRCAAVLLAVAARIEEGN